MILYFFFILVCLPVDLLHSLSLPHSFPQNCSSTLLLVSTRCSSNSIHQDPITSRSPTLYAFGLGVCLRLGFRRFGAHWLPPAASVISLGDVFDVVYGLSGLASFSFSSSFASGSASFFSLALSTSSSGDCGLNEVLLADLRGELVVVFSSTWLPSECSF